MLYRKHAYANLHNLHSMAEHEMRYRTVLALKDFKRAAERSSLALNVLTFVLVVLTVVLVIYTVRAG